MVGEDAPTLAEIIQLTRSELTVSQDDDEILECGRPALVILERNPAMCVQLAYQKLHDVPYREVKTCWRRLYTDAVLWKVLRELEQRAEREEEMEMDKEGEWITETVKGLDMALILTGAPQREDLVELWFSALQHHIAKREEAVDQRSAKRRKVELPDHRAAKSSMSTSFPSTMASPLMLHSPIPRLTNLSLSAFQTRISNAETEIPIIIRGAIDHWPALDERPWSRVDYLMERTLGGRRLVPVEIGRSYTDQGWGQKILSFGEFMDEYMFRDADLEPVRSVTSKGNEATTTTTTTNSSPDTPKTGYLAQHDLFAQIPSLRSDITIPDYCYSTPPPTTHSHIKPVPKLEDPLLNAWFGPANTISPLHTDPYHNILSQVVGHKYVRLYPPSQTASLHPRGVDDMGVDMSNTSTIDLEDFFDAFPERSPWRKGDGIGNGDGDGNVNAEEEKRRTAAAAWQDKYPEDFQDAEFVEGVVGPGDCLYIPVGWWHYVASLTPSFSVSFWFN